MNPSLTLITGGVRSGKSRHALELAQKIPSSGERIFIATAEALDEEMKRRIERHKAERAGTFRTVEEPVFLSRTLENIPLDVGVVVIDCMTLWISNLLCREGTYRHDDEVRNFLTQLRERRFPLILVTNEVGLGIMPENSLARRFMDELGSLNQRLAALADEVVFMVSGLPMLLSKEVSHAR